MSITKEDIRAFAQNKDQLSFFGLDPQAMVKEYHQAAGLPINEKPSDENIEFRADLLTEDTIEAFHSSTEENLLKELADILYVTYGWAVTYGWDLNEAFRRVHENNMTRMTQDDGTIKRREDGKIMKNPNTPIVDLRDLVGKDYD